MVKMGGLPDNLPVTDIGATFVPLLPALILVYREEKLHGVKRLLKRAFDRDRIKQRDWYVREQRLRGHPDARDGKHWQKCLSGQYRFA